MCVWQSPPPGNGLFLFSLAGRACQPHQWRRALIARYAGANLLHASYRVAPPQAQHTAVSAVIRQLFISPIDYECIHSGQSLSCSVIITPIKLQLFPPSIHWQLIALHRTAAEFLVGLPPIVSRRVFGAESLEVTSRRNLDHGDHAPSAARRGLRHP